MTWTRPWKKIFKGHIYLKNMAIIQNQKHQFQIVWIYRLIPIIHLLFRGWITLYNNYYLHIWVGPFYVWKISCLTVDCSTWQHWYNVSKTITGWKNIKIINESKKFRYSLASRHFYSHNQFNKRKFSPKFFMLFKQRWLHNSTIIKPKLST